MTVINVINKPSIKLITNSSGIKSTLINTQGKVFVKVNIINTPIVVKVTPYKTTAIKVVLGLRGPQGLSGSTVSLLPTETSISGHKVVMIDKLSGNVIYADPTQSENIISIIGITTQAFTAGDEVRIYSSGPVEEPTWNWDLDKQVYLDLNGGLTQVYPTTPIICIVGIPLTNKKLLLKFDKYLQ